MTAQLENLNLAIELSGMVLCLLGVLLVRIGTMADKSTERYFLLSYLVLLLFAGANLAGQLMRDNPAKGTAPPSMFPTSSNFFLRSCWYTSSRCISSFSWTPKGNGSMCGRCSSPLCWGTASCW